MGSTSPICLHPCQLALAKMVAAEEKVWEMLASGIIELSTSPWAGLVILTIEKDGIWWFCVH